MSGITDEAAIEGHDLIHNAEVEEERVGSTPPSATKLTHSTLMENVPLIERLLANISTTDTAS